MTARPDCQNLSARWVDLALAEIEQGGSSCLAHLYRGRNLLHKRDFRRLTTRIGEKLASSTDASLAAHVKAAGRTRFAAAYPKLSAELDSRITNHILGIIQDDIWRLNHRSPSVRTLGRRVRRELLRLNPFMHILAHSRAWFHWVRQRRWCRHSRRFARHVFRRIGKFLSNWLEEVSPPKR